LPINYKKSRWLTLKLLACHQHCLPMPHYRLQLKLTHGALP